MNSTSRKQPSTSTTYLILALLLLFGSIGVIVTTANDIDLGNVTAAAGMSPEETAYYEYVAPRLDRLVVEMDDVVVMVQAKSRDILQLTVSGNRIDTLTAEVTAFGEEHGVPARFQDLHDTILDATGTAIGTFDEARKALRTFDFSAMSGLVDGFTAAADELHVAQAELGSLGGGIDGA